MITDNEIYAISGKDLKQFVHLVSDLKDVAIDSSVRSRYIINSLACLPVSFISFKVVLIILFIYSLTH